MNNSAYQFIVFFFLLPRQVLHCIKYLQNIRVLKCVVTFSFGNCLPELPQKIVHEVFILFLQDYLYLFCHKVDPIYFIQNMFLMQSLQGLLEYNEVIYHSNSLTINSILQSQSLANSPILFLSYQICSFAEAPFLLCSSQFSIVAANSVKSATLSSDSAFCLIAQLSCSSSSEHISVSSQFFLEVSQYCSFCNWSALCWRVINSLSSSFSCYRTFLQASALFNFYSHQATSFLFSSKNCSLRCALNVSISSSISKICKSFDFDSFRSYQTSDSKSLIFCLFFSLQISMVRLTPAST